MFDSSWFSMIMMKKNENINLNKKILRFTFFLINLIFIYYIFNNLNSNFIYLAITNTSGCYQPILYKIVGSWGNHIGSILLWCWFLHFVGFLNTFILIGNPHFLSNVFRIHLTFIFSFDLFLVFLANPFITTNFYLHNNTELNPILQDVLQAIHPPLLYFSYALMSTLFALIISIDNVKNNREELLKNIKYLIIIIWFILAFGIALGSWWAYYELGWGGWWFWDPVENLALLPWIGCTILLHCLTKQTDNFYNYFFIKVICLLIFFFSLFSIFLVRSNLISSVHNFVSNFYHNIFLLMLLNLLFLIVIIKFYKIYYKNENYVFHKQLSYSVKDFLVKYNIFILLIIIFCIFLGIIIPILSNLFLNTPISFGPTFYNFIVLPLFYVILFIFSCYLLLKTQKYMNFYYLFGIFSGVFILFIINVFYFLQIKNVTDSFNFINYYNTLLPIKALEVFGIIFFIFFLISFAFNFRSFYFYIMHASLCLLVFAICLYSWNSYSIILNIKPGEVIKFNNNEILCRGYNVLKTQNYLTLVGNFVIKNDNSETFNTTVFFPEQRFYLKNTIFSSKNAICTNVNSDLIISLNKLFKNELTLQVMYNYGIPELWLGAFFLTTSGIYSFNFKNKTK